jgi:hypothetical protein
MEFTAIARITHTETDDVAIEVLSSDEQPGSTAPSTPVATITSVMRPGGPDPDPFTSAEHRIAYLLREIGWTPIEAIHVGTPFKVVRETRFRATVINHEASSADAVQVWNDDGELLTEVAISTTSAAVLEDSGWEVLGVAGDGWPDDTVAVSPSDWKVVIEQARANREAAQREATRRDEFWAACVREAILDGHTATELAKFAGVSAQRIYQVRDRRR